MLRHVRVRNIALIDEADIDLEEGLNVLTGETGAGKSILMGAINLALGARVGKEIMRDPSKGAGVELAFEEDRKEVLDALEEAGIEAAGGEIMISRRITSSGRSSCMINDAMVSTQEIRKIASLLIDIHGQHEHQSLLSASKHIELLDRFIQGMPEKLEQMRSLWSETEKARKELQYYEESGRDRARLLSLMEYELNEIAECSWKEGEEEALAEEKKHLMYAERLQRAALEASACMNGEGISGEGALALLGDALSKMKSACNYDEEFFGPFVQSMEEQLSVLEDVASELRDYGERTEADPARMDEIEDRLTKIYHLKDKYGNSREQVMAYMDKRQQEYDKLLNIEETVRKVGEEYRVAAAKMEQLADEMSRLRKDAAARIGEQITRVLATLQFEDPIFEVSVEEKKTAANGKDEVLFMIRTNVGEKIMPLNKIASGGEMSRVMLAIKTVLAEEDDIGTMIFDEIDTGISGRTAQSVAEKMSSIAVYHQVICVTHLPQIAAMADHHLRIEKKSEKDHTFTQVEPLSRDESIEELSRMLGGSQITDAVRQNAREMKALASSLSEKMKSQKKDK